MSRTADNGFDAAFVDRENHAVVLVEVKAHPCREMGDNPSEATGEIC